MSLSSEFSHTFRYEWRNRFKKRKVIHKHVCFGCGQEFKSRASMEKHQGEFWPGCPVFNKQVKK
jgi:hypothetical protein